MRRRVAQGQADQGWRCLSEASLARPRLTRATQRTGAAGRRIRLAFLYLLFLAKQEKGTAQSGAHPDTLPQRDRKPTPAALVGAINKLKSILACTIIQIFV